MSDRERIQWAIEQGDEICPCRQDYKCNGEEDHVCYHWTKPVCRCARGPAPCKSGVHNIICDLVRGTLEAAAECAEGQDREAKRYQIADAIRALMPGAGEERR